MKQRIIVFCGAFNPPTFAHLHAAQLAMNTVKADLLYWVPSKSRYISDVQKKDMAFSEEERYRQLQKMIHDDHNIARPGCEFMFVCRYELDAKEQPKTLRTLQEIQKLHPDAEIFLLLGSDKLPELETGWAFIDELLNDFRVIVLPRFHENAEQIISQSAFLNSHKTSFVIAETGVKEQDLSSTKVRQILHEIEKDWKSVSNMVPSGALEQIKKEVFLHA